jgi:hypothetical protein
MSGKIEARLEELGLKLPPAPQPLNSYQHVVSSPSWPGNRP